MPVQDTVGFMHMQICNYERRLLPSSQVLLTSKNIDGEVTMLLGGVEWNISLRYLSLVIKL